MNDSSAYKFLPPLLAENLRRVKLSARRPVEGSRQGAHRSPHHGASVEFAEYREYSPGEPASLIDWAVYARSDRAMVRRFQEETNLRACICLDTSESLLFRGSGQFSKMEYASFVSAGLMFILVNQGDSVRMFTFDRTLKMPVPATGSMEGLRPALLHLESISPSGLSDIELSLYQAADAVRHRSLFIIISDLLQPPEGILRGLRRLHHDGHDLMVLHVLDSDELRLPFHGLSELRELESGRRMVLETDEIRDEYERVVERYIETLRRGCLDFDTNYHLLNTGSPADEDLFTRITRR